VNKINKLLSKRDFLIISSIDWSENWQMHQQLATSLVESGNRVLFVENTGVRSPRVGDFSRISSRIRNWIKSTRGFFGVQKDLIVFSPIFIPLPYSKLALVINRFLLSRSIEKWIKIERYQTPVIISFLPTPLAQSLIEDINPQAVIYYCANDMAGGSSGASRLKAYEDVFFSNVDAVFCISHTLKEYAGKLNKRVFLLPAGVDFEKFEAAREKSKVPDDLLAIPGPIIGYVGAISSVFDQELLSYAARAIPEAIFVLIGPEFTNTDLLKSCPNIQLFGKRQHNDLPKYIKGFDVALIPYLTNAFTDSVYSCKLNEYMAMGVQTVATDMREIRFYINRYGNVLEISKTQEEFVEKIQHALFSQYDANRSLRIAAAIENSWSKRFEGICGVIEQLLVEKSKEKLDWQTRLTNYYRRGRMRIIRSGLLVLVCYCLLFYTPIVWFVGNQLTVRHAPKEADAIVVFSGDGETSYINQSYQRRTLDAIRYYQAGYAPLIILSTGKDQTFSEVEIIRYLLINRGIPQQAIQILEKYPRSTFENVALVKEALLEHGTKSILLITSPYHSRRALWVWRKAMPELVVSAPPVVDTPKQNLEWGATVNQIKAIFYEYLAIAYYRYQGWL
jgi:uncharacterized SAM-binding protein YcdF (DUF218 family)/glycosyltransferase involved in cell wall biosynthesis